MINCLSLSEQTHVLVRQTDIYWETGCGLGVLTSDAQLTSRFSDELTPPTCERCRAFLAGITKAENLVAQVKQS